MINIRYAKAEDAAVWTDINFKTWRTTYKNIFDEKLFCVREKGRDTRIESVRNNIRKNEKDKLYYHAVATKDNDLVGIITYGKANSYNSILNNNYCEVYAIYILEEYQKLGIGAKLIDFAKRDLKEDGYNKLVIWSLYDNPSLEFYWKIGGEIFEEKNIEIYGKTYRGIGFVFDI